MFQGWCPLISVLDPMRDDVAIKTISREELCRRLNNMTAASKFRTVD